MILFSLFGIVHSSKREVDCTFPIYKVKMFLILFTEAELMEKYTDLEFRSFIVSSKNANY